MGEHSREKPRPEVRRVTGEGVGPNMQPDANFRIESKAAWATVGILMVMHVLQFIDRSNISLMVYPIRRDLNISDFQLSLVQGLAFALFYAVCGIPVGWVIDRYSRRLIIFLGVTVWSIASANCGLANSYAALLFARFAVGAGEATLLPASYSLIADMFPRNRLGRANGIFSVASLLGTSIALVVGGAAIAYAERVGPVAFPIVGVLKPWQVAFMATSLGLKSARRAPRSELRPEVRGIVKAVSR